MLDPVLLLAFAKEDDAVQASYQHICLCRNEDILLPDSLIEILSDEGFNSLDGFELKLENTDDAFITGFNRFHNAAPMYGKLEITGNPVKNSL